MLFDWIEIRKIFGQVIIEPNFYHCLFVDADHIESYMKEASLFIYSSKAWETAV